MDSFKLPGEEEGEAKQRRRTTSASCGQAEGRALPTAYQLPRPPAQLRLWPGKVCSGRQLRLVECSAQALRPLCLGSRARPSVPLRAISSVLRGWKQKAGSAGAPGFHQRRDLVSSLPPRTCGSPPACPGAHGPRQGEVRLAMGRPQAYSCGMKPVSVRTVCCFRERYRATPECEDAGFERRKWSRRARSGEFSRMLRPAVPAILQIGQGRRCNPKY